jgi:hypothetical protein
MAMKIRGINGRPRKERHAAGTEKIFIRRYYSELQEKIS